MTWKLPKSLALVGLVLLIAGSNTNIVRAQENPPDQTYYLDECKPQYLEMWDLPKALKDKLASYQNGTTPIFIYRSTTAGTVPNSTQPRNVYSALIGNSSTSKFTMYFDEADLKAKIYSPDGFHVLNNAIVDEPKGVAYGFDPVWLNTDPFNQPVGDRWTGITTTPSYSSTTVSTAPDMNNSACFVTFMGNVSYAGSWTNRFAKLPEDLPYKSTNGRKQCDAWYNLPCHLSNLFIPDNTKLTGMVKNLQDSSKATFGFLAYPFTFLTDVYKAISGNTNNWCTEISCSKNFGNFYGTAFVFDFLAMKQHIPQAWTWGLYIIRGFTAVFMIFLVYRKYQEFLSR